MIKNTTLLILIITTTTTCSNIGWISQPVTTGQVIVVQGTGFNNVSCRYELKTSDGSISRTLEPIQPSEYSVKLRIPKEFPTAMRIYNLTVFGCGEPSEIQINTPQVCFVFILSKSLL